MTNLSIKLSEEPLDLLEGYQFVTDMICGAVNTFVGTVRNSRGDKEVTHLEFEVYGDMAKKEMQKIAEQAFIKWPCRKIAIHHRIGKIQVKEIAVIIAVSTPHRQASFAACNFIINELKKSVPIWKKEYSSTGGIWIGATP